jgi:hypothetical protein
MTKGFQYHHVFYSKDEANGWKNSVNARNSNLKAPPPGTHRTLEPTGPKRGLSWMIPHPTPLTAQKALARQPGAGDKIIPSTNSVCKSVGGGSSPSSSCESEPSSQESKYSASSTKTLSHSSTSRSGRQSKKYQSSWRRHRLAKNQRKTQAEHPT